MWGVDNLYIDRGESLHLDIAILLEIDLGVTAYCYLARVVYLVTEATRNGEVFGRARML